MTFTDGCERDMKQASYNAAVVCVMVYGCVKASEIEDVISHVHII